jgi:hypothetical protein
LAINVGPFIAGDSVIKANQLQSGRDQVKGTSFAGHMAYLICRPIWQMKSAY